MAKNTLDASSQNWPIVGARIPHEMNERLKKRYPEKGSLSKVIRALLQMHLDNKIGRLEFTLTQKI